MAARTFQIAVGARVPVWRCTARLYTSSAARLYDLLLCFHRHSRFVPSLFTLGFPQKKAPGDLMRRS